MTGIGGSFLGESLFRLAGLILENKQGGTALWREIAAAAVSPPTGFNRLAFGERFRGVFPGRNPAYFSRAHMGVSTTTQNRPGVSAQPKRREAVAEFAIDYGLPGKRGYAYDRPFDYFALQATAASGSGIESLQTRGLLLGRAYEAGPDYRGIWGLYGRFNYLAPQLFRVSSTALALGTTGEWHGGDRFRVQGTALLGAGYTAVGNIHGADNERDNHYGVSPQALLALRLIFGEQAMFDLTAAEYFVSRLGEGATRGRDNIIRADAAFTWRLAKQHAITVKYLLTRRDADFAALGASTQQRGTVGIFYTILTDSGFGSVDWRR